MRVKRTYCASAVFFLLVIASYGQKIADSAADFSATQGQANWYYGYYSSPFTVDTFQLLEIYGADQYGWTAWRHSLYAPPWIGISATNMHPSAPNYSGIPTQWAVRRWKSPYAGVVTVDGTIRKLLPKTAVDDGVTAYVLVDGQEMLALPVVAGDTNGYAFSVDVSVTNGSVVDFAVSPNGNDGTDGVAFMVTISVTEYRLGLSISGSQFSLRWASQTNRHYQIQFCPDLKTGEWSNLGDAVSGNGSEMVAYDTLDVGRTQKFYRLKILP